ncbi:right-handed parallel beta-helix repeat-containing protein [Methylomonas methanica]|nr:right-handed parallel beta-helix repeat-containing protein [Methylomonas methanica]
MINKSFSIIALICFSTTSMALDYYVAPSGNDQSSGLSLDATSTSGPFQTLYRAQQAIRDLKKNGQFNESVTVHIQPGTYTLQRILEFDIRDSGFADREIRWQGENGAVEISGGITLQTCTEGENKIWNCPTANLALDDIKYSDTNRKKGSIPGFELFVNQHRLQLARWPDSGWAHIKIPMDEKTKFSSFEQLPLLQNEVSRAQIHIFASNDWYDQYLPVLAIDQNSNQITLSAETTFPLASGRRFYLQNILSELNSSGEWFYDKPKARILFIPPDKVIPENIIVSSLQKLVSLKAAKNISFHNLIFRHSTETAISISNSSDITLNKLEVNNVGARAIEAVDSNNIIIANSQIYETGEGGILLTGGNRNTLQSSNNLAINNHIHHFGTTILTYSPAIRLGGVGGSAKHNMVEYAAGTGIILDGNDHLLEKNEVSHVCDQSSDCGAIYMGKDWTQRGNIIRNNSIHNIFGYGLESVDLSKNFFKYSAHGARGVYLDDAISGFTIMGNIFNNAGEMAIQLGGGRDNNIENNLFNTEQYAILVDNRWPSYNWEENKKRLKAVPYQSQIWRNKYPELAQPMAHENWPEGNKIRRNVIISNKLGGTTLRYWLPEQSNTLSDNLAWNTTGQFNVDYDVLDRLKKRAGAPWQEWVGEGIEHGSLNVDPCVTITGNRATFCAQSPVKQIGFQMIPSDIGLIK